MPENDIKEESSIEYFEEKPKGLSDITSNLKTGNCILVLGPMFGINMHERPIYETIQDYLREEDESLLLDDEFQNLYLVEKMDSYDQTEIEEMIYRAYERLTADKLYKFSKDDETGSDEDLYEKLTKIRFSAFINFTQDIFLNKAFDSKNLNYQFTYLSIYQTQKEFEKLSTDSEDQKAPFIYNLFGHYQHKQSLIYSYDRFYKFFFKTLSENNESSIYPPEIVKRLSEARIFILLGFDLKKWYVPIFIAKLCKIGRENKEDRPMVLAALNNTNKDNLPYVSWLTRYPLKLRFIKNSYDFINQLSKIPGILNQTTIHLNDDNAESANNKLSEEERKDFYERIGDVSDDQEFLNLINGLKSAYENKQNIEATKFMIGKRAELRIAVATFQDSEVTPKEHKVEIAGIRNKILDYISTN
ncbi:MAG: SIR2 family protein [Mucilaginibacter sp.]